MATLEVNPSLNGRLRQLNGAGGSETWATVIADTGNNKADGADGGMVYIGFTTQTTDSAAWRLNTRSIFLFDTSALPDDAIISSAVLSFYGESKSDGLSATPNINVYSANPASDVALVGADYSTCGSTPFCDTPVTYAGWSTSGYNDFTLNATGIAAISKTGLTKLSLRNAAYDVGATPPASGVTNTSSVISGYTTEETSVSNAKPKLVITYTVPSGDTSGMFLVM